MKVLVFGASGFIGFPVCQALSRGGHVVYGVTRSESNVKKLAVEEIIPIVGEYTDSKPWVSLVPTLDVVISAVGGADIRNLDVSLLRAVSEAAQTTRPASAPKLTYIMTSGIWIHGDNRKDVVTDTTPIVNPPDLLTWRPEVEQQHVNDQVLNGIVIRPALLYGKSGSVLESLFKIASEGKVAWYGTPGGRYSLVHADDLADLYLRVSEKAQLLGGKIIDAANPQTESVDDFLDKLVDVSGAKGPYEYLKPSNVFEAAIATTVLLRPYLARALVGWEPRKPGLIDGLPVYYAAWLATQKN
ncbi:hypothetical protein SERLA73DRAFT_183610 [Serpula lacrymans var. lacrymans S7.3]|uniref:NAD(P)-binding domain-containing protein n=2 Tax=Serpula lacrymans var. lacrymans TaxID=341189 RepID=F8Q076_SERL3|nr:uncharacterized protein SERLADRAFT_470879 [Serpula lacrymans var. lacrymans S7.9]EGN98548.1 hypothetical protein SERLA73DRAFT_183610 [Serpula lacrymans var. lacrymans S7.3]EGO24116.1 hypothetical protein SERLADRAFT_470879 [Serpula lacrymans var. lacrymans S7.9]